MVGARRRRVRSQRQIRRAGQAVRPNDIHPPTDATQWRPYHKTGGCDVIASLPIPATGHPGLSPATRNESPTFAPLHRPQADLHLCTLGQHAVLPLP